MRYVRFLKTPRIVREKNRPEAHVSCLITITSDLGDSFLPCNITLCAELIQDRPLASISASNSISDSDQQQIPDSTNNVRTWKTLTWTEGMRSLPVTLPLSKNYKNDGPLIVRIGTEPKSEFDDFDKLLSQDSRGVVSVWSAPFNIPADQTDSGTVERRLRVGHRTHRILEETGESIARHLWDAGVTLSCQLPFLLERSGVFDKALRNQRRVQDQINALPEWQRLDAPLQVIELGSGCSMVGIVLSHLVPVIDIFLTDLVEARAIAERNTARAHANRSNKGKAMFFELDWEKPLHEGRNPLFRPLDHPLPEIRVDFVIAADCTYNADSSPAFVDTIRQIAARCPNVTVVVAMKRRHSSEDVFFDLMSAAKFETVNTICFPLPGDEQSGEENVEIYVYEYLGEPARSAD